MKKSKQTSNNEPPSKVGRDSIRVQGAREHNLKNVTVEIPRDRFVVITGVSGSGKSSLAFDTIYAEGQRRYVESLSSYARQFLGVMEKPDVDLIEGLSPAISIEQKTTHRNPRSTVGTVTEIYDYLRLLYARAGQPHCYKCDRPVSAISVDQIVDRIYSFPADTKIQIMAPLTQGQKGEHKEVLDHLRKGGYTRIRLNGETQSLHEDVKLARNKRHTLDLVVDRLILRKSKGGDLQSRISQDVELALTEGDGNVLIHDGERDHVFSSRLSCTHCDISLPEITPRSFSFNSPMGACESCDGLGILLEFDDKLLFRDVSLSLAEGALAISSSSGDGVYWFLDRYLEDLEAELGFDILNTPVKKWPARVRKVLLHGGPANGMEGLEHYRGLIPHLDVRYRETKSDDIRLWMERFMSDMPCPACKGKRLRPESLAVRFQNKSVDDLTSMNIRDILGFSKSVVLAGRDKAVAGPILKEVRERLLFLSDVGVGYLTLDRSAGSLSGGEAQRIRLATQIGSALMGVLYILDEPSIGLHQRDNMRLLATLKNLRDMGNTVIVVEHDEETIRLADYVLDLGPGAGIHGGHVVAAGSPAEIVANPGSLTGQYLSGVRKIEVPDQRRAGNGKQLLVRKAAANNLKKVDVRFPLGMFVAITGVSGSGKSTLINDILYKALMVSLHGSRLKPGRHETITGMKEIDRVIAITQEPIGRTPRSNPATYTGVFTPVRELFSNLPEAKLRGYRPGRFSFNVRGGRCENCEGGGIIKIEMHFLPDVYVTCDTCKGQRFNRETLEVKYKGKTIYDVLDMTVEDALSFFENIPVLKRKLETVCEVGLGYIRLGQPATTLSGGEAQRVKLSTELSKRSTGRTLYILDEPTTGLHFADIEKLLKTLHSLVERGNSMFIIEHNLDVIKTADHIIDLGPEGGDEGGQVIVSGTPEEVAKTKGSHTGKFLKQMLVS